MSFLIDFCIPALLVSSAVLFTLKSLPETSIRLRASLAIVGLLAWFTPWHIFTFTSFPSVQILPLNQWVDTTVRVLENNTTLATLGPIAQVLPQSQKEYLWFLLFVPGLLFFLFDLWKRSQQLAVLQQQSSNGEHLRALLPKSLRHVPNKIRIIPGANALATGTFQGIIWVGEGLSKHQDIQAVLVHECCHLKRQDTTFILLINLARRLYCWNLVVFLLSRHLQLLIEQACDADSASILGRLEYQHSLARLIINSNPNDPVLAPMMLGGSRDYRRIRALESGSNSLLRWVKVIGIMTLACVLALSVNAQQPDPRLGEWVQQRSTSNYRGLFWVFEALNDGMTRTHIAANNNPQNRSYVDHRCDGTFYPLRGTAGTPTGRSLNCSIIDAYTVRSQFVFNVNPEQIITEITETISNDGDQYSILLQQLNQSGDATETTERIFIRNPNFCANTEIGTLRQCLELGRGQR